MKKSVKVTLLATAALIAGVALSSCGGSSNEIKIGAILPISGSVSTYGIQDREAIQLAFDNINKAGGVNGKKLVLLTEDDECKPEKTMAAFTKLTSRDNVSIIIGGLTSNCTNAITEQAQENKILLFSPTSTNDKVTAAGDYIFRACFTDSFQGPAIATFATQNLSAKKAAILFDNSNDYSKGLSTAFADKFASLGGKVVANESYTGGDKDFKAQLTKIKAAQPDVLFIPDYYNTVSLIAKQVRDLGITIPMLGGDGWDEIANNAGDEVLGCYYLNHYSPDADDPDVKSFVQAFKDAYKDSPNALAALGFDTANITAAAIKAAGSTDATAVRDALLKTDMKGVTGQIKFDANRNPVKPAVMIQIVKGTDGKLAAKFAGTVNP